MKQKACFFANVLIYLTLTFGAIAWMIHKANGQTLPSTQPTTLPVVPATVILPDGIDLSVYKFGSNTNYISEKANYTGKYSMSAGLTLTNLPNTSIRLQGSKVSINLAPGSASGIVLRNSPNCEIAGFDIVSAPGNMLFLNVVNSPHLYYHDCISDCIIGEMGQFDQGSDYVTALRVIAHQPTGSRLLYFVGTQHVNCLYDENAGSLGEDGIRFSTWTESAVPGAAFRNPRFVMVNHCRLRTIAQGGKQSATISMRNVGDGTPDDWCEISDCDLDGWVREGQAAKTPTVFNLRFLRNRCTVDRNHITSLSLMAATMSQCEGNTFYVDAVQRPIGWDSISCKVCLPVNNIIYTMDPSVRAKQLMIEIRSFAQNPGAGTKVQVRPDYAPPPKTQPTTKPATQPTK